MSIEIKPGTTSRMEEIFIPDSSSAVGAGLTGLVFNSAGFTVSYYREGAGTGATSITLADQTLGTWTSGGFKEIPGQEGMYEIGIPDAVLASGVEWVVIQFKGAANMAPTQLRIQLKSVWDEAKLTDLGVITAGQIMDLLLAVADGKIDRVGNVWTYKGDDGTTIKTTQTVVSGGRTVS